MRTIEIDKELLLVEVPKDASDFELRGGYTYNEIKKNPCLSFYGDFDAIILPYFEKGALIGLIETPNLEFYFEVHESWVESSSHYYGMFKNYLIELTNSHRRSQCFDKKQSFRTRIQKTIQDNGLYLVNPLGEKKYIPVKRCGAVNDFCSYGEIYCECKKRMKWQQAEEKTIKGNLLLIKKN